MAVVRQSSTLPPAQPSYILRGHASQIHSVQFVRDNTRLLTGDADGWIICWKLETKRALAVWKAHEGAILGTAVWGHDKIVTHGRDNALRIWQVRDEDESALSAALPAEVTPGDRPIPWLLHSLPVNTLNFCAFSMCIAPGQEEVHDNQKTRTEARNKSSEKDASIFIAVPARDDKKAEVYQFPEEKLKHVVPRAQSKDTGMVMAVKLAHIPAIKQLLVITGYEGGLTAVHTLPKDDGSAVGIAQLVYLSQPHTQPILSLDVAPDTRTYFTSGADAIIAAHRIPDLPARARDGKYSTAQASDENSPISVPSHDHKQRPQPNSTINVDDDITEAAVDDPPISIPENEHCKPLAFAKRPVTASIQAPQPPSKSAAGLTSLFSNAPPATEGVQPASSSLHAVPAVQAPYKAINTKHAGQQSLAVRSDGRLLATGGWDTRVRIYSATTLKEVAVLKWHKEGVYAVAFGSILAAEDSRRDRENEGSEEANGEVAKRETGLSKLQRQREKKMQVKHWVAAGAKDGKVSLWEVF